MSPDSHEEFVAYSDEAQHNVGSVRGVGAVSLRATDGERLAGEVAALVASSGVSECKWELVRSARQSFAAEKLLAWALDAAIAGHLWIDVLTWSPDAAPALTRLRAMYARLLDQSVRSHGPRGSWRVYPDEQQALEWSRILARIASRAQIERVAPSKSHTTPLIQVADLFVGLAVFSRSSYDAYARWRSFPDDERNVAVGRFAAPVALPASLRYRCALLDEFYTTCLRRLPGISLRTRGGLHTHATDSPIQFQWA
jgi:hypothetical protein